MMQSHSVQSLLQSATQNLKLGNSQQAVTQLLQIVSDFPGEPRSRFTLAFIAHREGNIPGALGWLSQAIRIDPAAFEPYFLLGLIHQQQHHFLPAIDAYQKCIARRPNDDKALNNLGRCLLDIEKPDEAISFFQRAIKASATNAGALSNLGDALRIKGDLAGAVAQFHKALLVDPNCGEAHANLGVVLYKQGKLLESARSISRAIAIDPRSYNRRFNLARVFQDAHQLDEALEQCQIALRLNPGSAEAHNLLANLLGIMGHVSECISHQQKAVELEPGFTDGHSNLLLSMHYLPEYSPQLLYEAHLRWADLYTLPPVRDESSYQNDRSTNRRLRIGYLSPNFNSHSVAYFFEPVLAAHDAGAVEIYCYSNSTLIDAVTERMKKLSGHWRVIAGISDDAALAIIREDQIDILIDLAGHTASNRLPLLANRPAPVQMTWIGYPGSTGMTAIDYRITDSIADPPGESDTLHTEKLLRVEGGPWTYQPPPSPEVGRLPALANGHITFGSFNNLPKVTPQVLGIWGRILQTIPDSRLMLKSAGLCGKMGRDYVMSHLTAAGIDLSRIELLSWSPNTMDHLQLYNRMDIALDTFPYNGTTTTCEALWMGVPVITVAGSAHVSRVGAALLTHAGFPQWIARHMDHYIEFAANLSEKIDELSSVRKILRETMRSSRLCDGQRLSMKLEQIYQNCWRDFVASLPG